MLTLICGLPRAGKTTYSAQFPNVIHLDTSGAYRGVEHKIKSISGDIVVEGVYHKREQRERIIKAYGGDGFKCIWLNTPQEIRRTRRGWDKRCDFTFDPPTYSEGWDEIIVIGEDDGNIQS